MRKLLSAAIISLIFSYANVSANTENEVYKVIAVNYNQLLRGFEMNSLGSSVLVGDNTLVTNAHVVLDEKDEPMGYYIACKTLNFEKIPDCRYHARLVRYDKNVDLAILKIESTDFAGKPAELKPQVTVFTGKLNIGDEVSIYGYPGIGGATITMTKGRISGFEDGKYKTDSTVDQGNSGGGAFNKDGVLIGIPNMITSSHSTLGWIIPGDKVIALLENADTGAIVYDDSGLDFAKFKKMAKVDLEYINKYTFDLKVGENASFSGILKEYDLSFGFNYENFNYIGLTQTNDGKMNGIIMRTMIRNAAGISEKEIITRLRAQLVDSYDAPKCSKVIGNAFLCINQEMIGLYIIRNYDVYTIFAGSSEENVKKADMIASMKSLIRSMKINKVGVTGKNEDVNFGDIVLKGSNLFFYVLAGQGEQVKLSLEPKKLAFTGFTATLSSEYDKDALEGQKYLNDLKKQFDSYAKEDDNGTTTRFKKNADGVNMLLIENSELGYLSAVFVGKNGYYYSFDMKIHDQSDVEKNYASIKKIFSEVIDKGIIMKK